ncbi:hypothetical protein Tco_1403639 [Tanacetum coccineum]
MEQKRAREIAITTVNVECSAIIMNQIPRARKFRENFYPWALQELDRDSFDPTRMTLELANRSITHPMGIAEDVVVRVDGFTFLADFVGKEDIVLLCDKSEKNKNKHFVHAISVIDFSKDDPFSGSTTTHSDDPSPSSSPVKTSDNFEKFADELAPLDSLPPGNVRSLKEGLHEEIFMFGKCFTQKDDIDEIDGFSSYGKFFLIFKEDDLIPPGVENVDPEDEDHEVTIKLDTQDDPSISYGIFKYHQEPSKRAKLGHKKGKELEEKQRFFASKPEKFNLGQLRQKV